MAKFGIGQPVRGSRTSASSQARAAMSTTSCCPAWPSVSRALAARPRPHQEDRRFEGEGGARRAAVLTGADVAADKLAGMTAHLMPEDFGAPKGHRTFLPLLVADKVRCIGDRVAFVVAETEAQARDAAEMVEVEYEPLPAVVDLEDAAQGGRAEGLGRQPKRATRRSA